MASEAAIAKARQLCKTYGVKYRFLNKLPGNAKGLALSWASRIRVNKTLNDTKFISVVFHEIQHVLNYRNGKYYEYHTSGNMKVIRKWALRAENYTDDQAQKLAASHGFHKYQRTYYRNDFWRKRLHEYYKD